MAQRLVRFSDLTNKIIDDDEVVRIVVEQHPALQNGPVELEAAADEVEAIRTSVLNVVSLKLYPGDGSAPETATMEVEAFNKTRGRHGHGRRSSERATGLPTTQVNQASRSVYSRQAGLTHP